MRFIPDCLATCTQTSFRHLIVLTGVVAALCLSVHEAAAQNASAPNNTAMATRSVSKYLALERALLAAFAAQDKDAANQILDPEFELRSASEPQAITADDFISNAFQKVHSAGLIRDLNVFETDGVSIVSFILDSRHGKARSKKIQSLFIVDVWKNSDGKLLIRYQDIPAHQIHASERPDGRE